MYSVLCCVVFVMRGTRAFIKKEYNSSVKNVGNQQIAESSAQGGGSSVLCCVVLC